MVRGTGHQALIPMIGGTGAICRVVCDGHIPAPHPAQLDPRTSALLETGLYAAGQQAIAASSALRLPASGWLSPPAAALAVLNPGDVSGLAPENARSAELGLALVWLLHRCGSSTRQIAATGLLDPSSSEDVSVLPVHGLGDKLQLLIRQYSKVGASRPPAQLLIPCQEPDGSSSLETHRESIAHLQTLGVKVMAVPSLRDAAAGLGLRRLARSPREAWTRRAAALSAVVMALVLLTAAVLERPIDLQFGTAATPQGRVLATPARARMSTGGGIVLQPPCASLSTVPIHPVGEVLAVRVTPSSADPLPLYGVVVAVASSTGAKVLPLPKARLDPAHGATFTALVAPPEEDNLLVFLARRLRPFDAADLQQKLQSQLFPLRPEERLSAARNWLRSEASGYAEYFFRSVPRGACA